ncbi:hypothetical protein ACFLVI_00700 [Chloroflexota bacterium]
MGKRDYRHHETKKPKKGERKPPAATILSPPATVEVIRKGKGRKETEEEE